jgi:hypothetical protein
MKILNVIDRGSFGRVERVELSNGTLAARKVFDPDPGILAAVGRPALVDRFKREVRIQKNLNANYIIPILHEDLNAADPWFLMPLADRNFHDEIDGARNSGIVPYDALADIINALEELHKGGFTHRDLTPGNILFQDSRWKLSDLGLIQPPRGAVSTLTGTGDRGGTPDFCAPEQVLDFKHVTAQADIYSFGCILHDCISRTPRVPHAVHTVTGPLGPIVERCTETLVRRFKTIGAVRTVLMTFAASSMPTVAVAADTTDWINRLPDIENWDNGLIIDFIRFIQHIATLADIEAVFKQFDETRLLAAKAKDDDLWSAVTKKYCEWATGSFLFAFTDVLANRLGVIFQNGSIEDKALSAIAIACLGSNHHRFYVMQKLIDVCSPSIDETLAQRIGIEMVAQAVENDFYVCANSLNKTLDIFHPKIRDLIAASRPMPPPP